VLDGRAFDTDARRLLGALRPDIVVIVTPIHTHAALAERAMLLGAHVLLEKPPVTCLAEHDRLLSAATAAERHCQVGFQAFGSSVVRDLIARVRRGDLGRVERISAVGCWHRGADYYTRSPWAGRRRLGETIVADGALTNPFAHGVALALRLADADDCPVRDVHTEPYHAYPIETDDTISARIVTGTGVPVTVAATLCAADEFEPYVDVHASAGRATVWYTEDRVSVDTGGGPVTATGDRVSLIDDLIDHLHEDPAAGTLCSPLRATRAFTEVLEAVWRGPAARPIPERYLLVSPDGRTIPGVEKAVVAAGEAGVLLSQLDLPWTRQEEPVE
jgi:predicted dehydrogenase